MKPVFKTLSPVLCTLFIAFVTDATAQCTIPQNIDSVSVTGSSINIKWDAVSSAQFYQTNTVNPPTAAGSQSSIYNYLSLNGLEHNKTYCISVRAVCGVNDTSAWDMRCFTTTCTGVQMPSLEVDKISQVSARATWKPFSAAGAYEYAITDTGVTPNKGEATINTSVLFQGLEPDKEYCLHVRAFCSATNTNTAWTTQCFKTSPKPTTGISAVKSEVLTFLYPNPATDVLNIAANLSATHKVSISDITGKVLLNTTVDNSNKQMNVGGLAAGMYLISVKGNDVTLVQRFVKQ